MFTVLPVFAAATSKSVCLAKKAGICRTSTYFEANAASDISWISVNVGILNLSDIFFRIF